MRILIYVPTIALGDNSGGSIHVHELGENLSRLGNRVVIICRLGSDAYDGLATIKRVRVPGIKVIGWLLATIYGLFLGLMTSRRDKYDLIYTRSGLSASAWLIYRLSKTPYITEVNGLIWDEAKISWVGWWRKVAGYLLDRVESRAYGHSQHLVVVTRGIRDALLARQAIESGQITVIVNGVNTNLFKPLDTNETRKKLNLDEHGYLIVLVGKLLAWQGAERLIKCFPYVIREYPESRLLIVGDGPLKSELVTLARSIGVQGKVIFTGAIAHQEVPLYINASNICVTTVQPVRSGYSALKLYEYMACGRPVVATRTSGFEILEGSDAGLLVNPEDPQEFANTIIKLLQHPELRKRMGKNGRKYVVENHSWASVAKRVAEVCEQTLQEHNEKQNKRKL